MNTVNNRGFRYLAMAALVAVGIVTTIATGGGGGSGDGGFEPDTSPTLNITADNGLDVATAVIVAVGLSYNLGDITGGNVASGGLDIQSGAEVSKLAGNFFKTLLPGVQQALENCANGGTVDVTITQANVNTITIGDRIVAVFVDCDDGLGYVISGRIDIRIAAIQGDILTDVFLLGMDVLMTDVIVTEGTSLMTTDGDFTLTLDSLDFPVVRTSLSGDSLRLGSDGEEVTLTAFDHALQLDLGVSPEALVANVFGRLQSSILGGSVDYETATAIEAIGDEDPHVGVMLITGADNSSIRVVIIDSSQVQLEVDENGDRTVDEFIDTTWDELNGREPVSGSAITSENAPILAREVYNAVTGFGSLTITAGSQFVPAAPFGLLDEMDIMGAFEALPIGCNLSGTAIISGFKATTNTYSSGDTLDAGFDACIRGGEKLDGSMALSISSFDETPADAYAVTATVVESSLRRVFGGSCFTGIGEFDTNYDFMFTTAGLIQANSATADFNVATGGRSQQISGASVSAQIVIGQQPVVVTRASSGVMSGTDISGTFSYQSVVPDEFLSDTDSATGPYTGELLVTAADNSSMRMVAVDEFNVRLDLDFNGDGVIDQSIPTTYATLGYGEWFCL
jgi:hypothetical protein